MDEQQQSGPRVTRGDAAVLLTLALLDQAQLERGALTAVAHKLKKSKPTIHRHFARLQQAGYLEASEIGIHLALPETIIVHAHPALVSCTNPPKHVELTFQELTALQAAITHSNPTLLASCSHYTLSPPFRGRERVCVEQGGANKNKNVRQKTLEIFSRTRGKGSGKPGASSSRMIRREDKSKKKRSSKRSKLDHKILREWPTTPRGRRKATARVRRYLTAGGFGDLDAGIIASAAGFALRRGSPPQGLPDRYSEAVEWLLSNLGPESRR